MAKVVSAQLDITATLNDGQARSALQSLGSLGDSIEKKLSNLNVKVNENSIKKGIKAAQDKLKDPEKVSNTLSKNKLKDPKEVYEHYSKNLKQTEKDIKDRAESYNKQTKSLYDARDSLADIFKSLDKDPNNTQLKAQARKGAQMLQDRLGTLDEDTLKKYGILDKNQKKDGTNLYDAFMSKMGKQDDSFNKWKYSSLMKKTAGEDVDKIKFPTDLSSRNMPANLKNLVRGMDDTFGFLKEISGQGFTIDTKKADLKRLRQSFGNDAQERLAQQYAEMQGMMDASWDRMNASQRKTFKSKNPDFYHEYMTGRQTREQEAQQASSQASQGTQLNLNTDQAKQQLMEIRSLLDEIKATTASGIEFNTSGAQNGISNLLNEAKQLKETLNTMGVEKISALTKHSDLASLTKDQEAKVLNSVKSKLNGNAYDVINGSDLSIAKDKLKGSLAYKDLEGLWKQADVQIPLSELFNGKDLVDYNLDDLVDRFRTNGKDLDNSAAIAKAENVISKMEDKAAKLSRSELASMKVDEKDESSQSILDAMDDLQAKSKSLKDGLKSGLLSPSEVQESASQLSQYANEYEKLITLSKEYADSRKQAKAEEARLQKEQQAQIKAGAKAEAQKVREEARKKTSDSKQVSGKDQDQILSQINEQLNGKKYDRAFLDKDLLKTENGNLKGILSYLGDDQTWKQFKVNAPLSELMGKNFSLDDLFEKFNAGMVSNGKSAWDSAIKKQSDEFAKLQNKHKFSQDDIGNFKDDQAINNYLKGLDNLSAMQDRINNAFDEIRSGRIAPSEMNKAVEDVTSLNKNYSKMMQQQADMLRSTVSEAPETKLSTEEQRSYNRILKDFLNRDQGRNYQTTNEGLSVHRDGLVRGSLYRKDQSTGEWFKERIARSIDDVFSEGKLRYNSFDPIFNSIDAQPANSLKRAQKNTKKFDDLLWKMDSGSTNLNDLADIDIKVSGEDRITSLQSRVQELVGSLQTLKSELTGVDAGTMNPKLFDQKNEEFAKKYKELSNFLTKDSYKATNARGTLAQSDILEGIMQNDPRQAGKQVVEALKRYNQANGLNREGYDLTSLNMAKGTARVRSHDKNQYFTDTVNFKDMAGDLSAVNNAYRVVTQAEGAYLTTGQQVQKSFMNKLDSIKMYMGGLMLVTGAMDQVRNGIQTVTDLDSQLTNINMTMNASSKELNGIKTSSLQLGTQLGTTATNVMDAVTIYANASETAESIVQKAAPTVMLSNASKQDIGTSANQLQSITQQFDGLEGKEKTVVSSLEKISAGIAMDFSDGIGVISEGVQVAGSVANEAGLNFNTFAASVAKVAEKTRLGGSQIGNAYKTILARTSRSKTADENTTAAERSKAAESLADLGINVYDTNGAYQDFGKTLDQVSDIWDTLTDAQQANLAENMAGESYARTHSDMW